jgi:hypothetical protein
LSVAEVSRLAREIVMAGIDPLPLEELGEPFDFEKWRPSKSEPMEAADLLWINPVVPPPDARVDLDRAWDEFKRDSDRCRRMLESFSRLLKFASTRHDILCGKWVGAYYNLPIGCFGRFGRPVALKPRPL